MDDSIKETEDTKPIKRKKTMSILIDLNKAFVIRQESGRKVPLNDLDCCLISMKELKIEHYFQHLKIQKELQQKYTGN